MGRSGSAILHRALGWGGAVVAAIIGTADRHGSGSDRSVLDDPRTTARQHRLSIRRRGRTAAAVCIFRSRRDVLPCGRRTVGNQAVARLRRRPRILLAPLSWGTRAVPLQAD